ncbi:hypothetical protein [Aeoliella mucimassa]|uniref:hypothetical protein n=1 Tax=Aeoliella mucimassa TaxID=2527972 RepID=UPI0011A2A3C5|nr:hypothetical protein [Aeoliella mucimassa]
MRSISHHSYSSVSDLPFLFVDSERTSTGSSSAEGRAQQQHVVHTMDNVLDDWCDFETSARPGATT